jgi:uncharacterized repeat protein (TIGR03806 family)
MTKARELFAIIAGGSAVVIVLAVASSPAFPAKPDAEPPAQRVPWTASRVMGTPEPPPPYATRRVYPHLAFRQPTSVVPAPGTDRLFVTELSGNVYSFPDDSACAEADLFVDAGHLVARLAERTGEQYERTEVYGLAFHPDFATNRLCYLSYAVMAPGGKPHPHGARVVQLRVGEQQPPRCDPESEVEIISWRSGGHQGGCLAFGPDGCLYISTGDAANPVPPDELATGQDVTDLLASVLRIDVSRQEEGRAYAIPPDNPLVRFPEARGEIFAYGMRNPWKMSFDRGTGQLWVGDVGWEMWEWVQRVRPGDNFGWSVMDGTHPLHQQAPRGPTPIVPPTVELSHADAASLTGGYVYRGSRLPDLVGTYVFGDWETRRIWGVAADAAEPGPVRDLADPSVRVISFGEKLDGELLVVDFDEGTLHELVPNDAASESRPFPTRLSETGLFADTASELPMPGVLPFEVQAEAWADHASARRFVGVPGDAAIGLHPRAVLLPGSMFAQTLHFPAGTVLAKTFSMEMDRGKPESSRRIETQLLHFDGRTWRGYTYAWTDAQTDAELVPAAGKKIHLEVVDAAAPGGLREQAWTFAGRNECLRCHNPWAEHALAFNVRQLNRDVGSEGLPEGSAANQLRRFRAIGLIEDRAVPPDPADGPYAAAWWPGDEAKLPRLADPRNPRESLDARARGYLHANCAHCHRFGGGGSAYVLLDCDKPLHDTKAVGLPPQQGSFGIPDSQIIAPGDPYRSALFYRMATIGPGRMPHIGSEIVDASGLGLIHDWIKQLPVRGEEEQMLARLITLDERSAAAAADRDLPRRVWRRARQIAQAQGREEPDDADQARADTEVRARDRSEAESRIRERQGLIGDLLATTSRAVLLSRAVAEGRLPAETRAAVLETARGHADPVIVSLFEQHLPATQRQRRLGTTIDPAAILSVAGDAARGRALYETAAAVQCRNCHRLGGAGRDVGPALDDVGGRLDRAKLLESILEPSKTIEPKYRTWSLLTADGRSLSGVLVSRTESEVRLRDAQGAELVVPAAEVESLEPQPTSLMPEHQFRDLTAAQAADLLAFLESLRPGR